MNKTLSFTFNNNLSIRNYYYTNTNYLCGYLVINYTDKNEMMKNN